MDEDLICIDWCSFFLMPPHTREQADLSPYKGKTMDEFHCLNTYTRILTIALHRTYPRPKELDGMIVIWTHDFSGDEQLRSALARFGGEGFSMRRDSRNSGGLCFARMQSASRGVGRRK